MSNKQYKSSLFYVIMGIILCAGIALLLNYSIFSNKQYVSQYNAFVLQNVKNKKNDISKNLAYMNNMLMDIKMSEEVKRWSKCKDTTSIYLEAINVQKEIRRQTIYNNDLKYEIGITFLDDRDLVVGPDLTGSKDLFFQTFGFSRDEVDKICEAIKSGQKHYIVKKSENKYGECYVHYFTKFNYNHTQLLYVISINEANLVERMNDDTGDYYIFNTDEIIAEKQEALYDIDLIHQTLKDKVDLSKMKGHSIYNIRGKKVIVEPLNELGWSIGYIYSPPRIKPLVIVMRDLCVLVIALIIGIIIARLTTEKLYKPIRKVLEEIGGKNILEQKTLGNEFEYIASHNKKIEKENDQLCEVIEKNKSIIKEKIYKELLNGIKAYKKEEYKEYKIKNERIRIVLIEFENPNQRLEDEQTYIVKESIKSKVITMKDVQYVNIDYKTCCLLIKDHLEITTIKKMMLQIMETVESRVNLNVKIFLGGIANSLDELHDFFLNAKKSMEYKNAFPNKLIITEEDVAALSFKVTTFPVRIENKLITNTVHGEEEALSLLEEMIKENLESSENTAYHKKNFILAIIVTLNRIFDQVSVVPQEYLGESYEDYLALYETYNDEVPNKIRNLFSYIIGKIQNQELQTKKDMAEQMMEYIHTNYVDDIMLEDMSATLDISVKYCSVLFKRVTGENFKTVLNEYRVQKAKELLEETDLKVSDIGAKVGFNSTNTFIRVFNKYVGISPGGYQEQNAKRAL